MVRIKNEVGNPRRMWTLDDVSCPYAAVPLLAGVDVYSLLLGLLLLSGESYYQLRADFESQDIEDENGESD